MRGFDTETVNRKGHGYACLLTCSDGRFKEFPKTFEDCFRFLADENNGTSRYMAWNMDFDARAVMHERFLPYRVLEALALGGRAEWGVYKFHYIPRKFFRASKNSRVGFELFDLAQYYGMRLADAARAYLKEDVKDEIPKTWYPQMDECLRDTRRDAVLKYGIQDACLVEKLFGILRESFDRMGLSPEKWISPASLSVLKFKEALENEPRIPFSVQEIFRRTFYGGRIEVQGLGNPGRRRLYLYDIRSAYPAEAAKLTTINGLAPVSSLGGSWTHNPATVYGAYHVEAEIPKDWKWGPLAVRRKDGEIIYPVGDIETWCGKSGLSLLQNNGIRFKVQTAYEYLSPPGYSSKPVFSEIPALYLERKNPSVSLAVKLVLNSLYGKLAENLDRRSVERIPRLNSRAFGMQKIRTVHGYGRHTNYVFASSITENTRLKLWTALRNAGSNAYMCMTDSILSATPLETGPSLGDWSEKMKVTEAVILGSGRYYLKGTDEKGEPHEDFRFRGFSPDKSHLEKLRRCHRSSYTVQDLRTGSLVQWARRCGIDDLNVLEDCPLEFQLQDEKRYYEAGPARISDSFDNFYPSDPYIMEGRKLTKRDSYDFGS